VPAFKLPQLREGSRRICQGQNRTRENRPCGIVGGLTETWAMVWTKRAHTVETLKQPSPDLRLRASYFYPDPAFAFALHGRQRST
jgi:hypothetical protein